MLACPGKRLVLSFRGDAKHRTRNLEIPGSLASLAPPNDEATLLLAVAEAAVERADDVGIVVGPAPLLFVVLGLGPLFGCRELADIRLVTGRHHHRGREDIFVVAAGILAEHPAPQIVGVRD